MNIVPMEDRVILKKVKEEEEPKKGVLIVPSSIPKQDRYEVITYSETLNGTLCLSGGGGIGSIVYIDKYKGMIVNQDGIDYVIVKIEDIIAYERTT